MGDSMQRQMIPAEESFRKWKNDPEFVVEYDALESKFSLASALIEAQRKTGKPQE